MREERASEYQQPLQINFYKVPLSKVRGLKKSFVGGFSRGRTWSVKQHYDILAVILKACSNKILVKFEVISPQRHSISIA